MQYMKNKRLTPLAQNLRHNATSAEKRLWFGFLRNHPIKFRRQKVMGKYIADFYCKDANIVLELDGTQHCTEEGIYKDEERTAFLASEYGVTVYRISNFLVFKDFPQVKARIDRLLMEHTGLSEDDLMNLRVRQEEAYVRRKDGANG